jgi:hypothetical protein
MRKATAILLLLVFLFEGGGYFVYFTIERAAAQRDMAAFMARLRSEENLIRIEWNAGNAADFEWKHDREFRLHGVMYDVMRKEQSHDGNTILFCHPDKRESALYLALEGKSKKSHPGGDLPGRYLRLAIAIPEEPLEFHWSLTSSFGGKSSCAVFMHSDFYGRVEIGPPEQV